ncbi:MAG: hypothetical protein ACE5EX_06045 [Phycisphaerae bacterium]
MRRKKTIAWKTAALILMGSLVQFGGCGLFDSAGGGFGALIALAATPLFLQTFGIAIGGP